MKKIILYVLFIPFFSHGMIDNPQLQKLCQGGFEQRVNAVNNYIENLSYTEYVQKTIDTIECDHQDEQLKYVACNIVNNSLSFLFSKEAQDYPPGTRGIFKSFLITQSSHLLEKLFSNASNGLSNILEEKKIDLSETDFKYVESVAFSVLGNIIKAHVLD